MYLNKNEINKYEKLACIYNPDLTLLVLFDYCRPDSVLNSFNKMGDMHGHGTGAFPMASMFPGMMTNPYFGAGIMGGYSGIPGYSGFSGLTVPSAGYLGVGANNGMGFMGGHGLAAGNMGGLPTGFGMFGAPTPPDFGVMAEIDITAGFNTFMIQGLGKFMDLNELSGRGIAVSNFFVLKQLSTLCYGKCFFFSFCY